MDQYPSHHHSFDPFSDETINAVETVEALPFSHAFERVMYDARINRTSEHASKRPIVLTESFREKHLPQELQGAFYLSSYEINELTVSQSEDADGAAAIDISFLANKIRHNVHSEHGTATYHVESHAQETKPIVIDVDSVIQLLGTLAYASQFDERNPEAIFRMAESHLQLPRNIQTSLVERLIMTLGNHDGSSAITTTSLFESDPDVLVAKLIERETPSESIIQNQLDLTSMSFADTKLFQDRTNVFTKTSSDTRFAERYTDEVPELIDPKEDYLDWAKICVDFLSIVKKPLDAYSDLDQ